MGCKTAVGVGSDDLVGSFVPPMVGSVGPLVIVGNRVFDGYLVSVGYHVSVG